ncbi:hypothetical protein HYDPIDRAFT_56342, partial [Hydnomerulius pinastri MD-312]
DPILTIDHFRPLLQLRSLAHMEINVQCTICLNNAAITEMAKAWPSLEFLYLNFAGWTVPSEITPVGFISLLTHCPKLKDLGIVVDFTSVPEQLPALPLNTAIEQYEAGTSPIEKPEAVAEFLACIMPNLKAVVGW